MIRKNASRMNIFIHSEMGGRWPGVIINVYTLEVALDKKVPIFSNITPKEFPSKQESRFSTVKF